MTADTPTNLGGSVENWSITPTLPTGLVFDEITGTISGTPTVNSPTTTYTITANNTGGSATTTVEIAVNDVTPSTIVYSGDPFTLTNGVPMSADTPTAAGGAVDSWSISPICQQVSPLIPQLVRYQTPTVLSPLSIHNYCNQQVVVTL